MGGGSWYRAGMRPESNQYRKIGEIEGIKVISKIEKRNLKDPREFQLPTYSHTADTMYLAQNEKGQINQLRIFTNNRAAIDFDWTHDHFSEKGKEDIFRVHVHEWDFSKEVPRSVARKITDAEWELYKDLFKKIDKRLHK